MNDYLRIEMYDEAARVYREGGVGYDVFVPGIGWAVNDDSPSADFAEVVKVARAMFLYTAAGKPIRQRAEPAAPLALADLDDSA